MLEHKSKDRSEVLPQAFEGYVRSVARDLKVSDKRLYNVIVSYDPYRRCWQLLEPLGKRSPQSLERVRADFNSRCDAILKGNQEPSSYATVHHKCSTAVQSILERQPHYQRSKLIREAIAELQKELAKCEE